MAEEGKGPLRLEEVAKEANLKAKDLDHARARWGVGLAWGVIALIAFVLILIGIYALATYPDPMRSHEYLGKAADPEELRDLREGWFSNIKDLLQLLVVSLLVPLLATLVGYIFGRQSKLD